MNKQPTAKQVAARARNWKRGQLKSARFVIACMIPRNELGKLDDLCKLAEIAIDRRWESEKQSIQNKANVEEFGF